MDTLSTLIGFSIGVCAMLLAALGIMLPSEDPGAGRHWDCTGNGKAAVHLPGYTDKFITYGDVCVAKKDEG